MTPLETRKACEAKIEVCIESLARPEEQALLYKHLRALGWCDEKVRNELRRVHWDLG